MKFIQLLVLGTLCASIGVLGVTTPESPIVDASKSKQDKQTIKKATVNTEKKSPLDKKTSQASNGVLGGKPLQSTETHAELSATIPVPVEDLVDVTPEYETFPDEPDNFTQSTLAKNETGEVSDLRYYFIEIIPQKERAKALWVDLNTLPKHQVFKHDVLSESHRRAASINLPFKFPFYGQNLTKATIATGGFLYMGEHIHSWLAATQYIAPLMAHFDTRNSNDSNILYGYNASLFVIQWEKVNLYERNNTEFTFQCILYRNGNIAFVYKDIPISINDISDVGHPVKIGVSDAYFIQRAQVYVRRKTIYEYHKVEMINSTIGSNTAIFLTAKPTCITLKTCGECVSAKIDFECTWCLKAQRCSDGYDRQRQDWISNGCDSGSINTTAQCIAPIEPVPVIEPIKNSTAQTTNSTSDNTDKHFDVHDDGKNVTELSYNTQESKMTEDAAKRARTGGHWAVSFMFFVALIGGVAFWALYAYRNPTSSSGQLLIRWRPTHWRWVYPETRYTAASIHM